MGEEWRPVVGFRDYEVSSHGRVRSWRRPGEPKLIKPTPNGRGYLRVGLVGPHGRVTFRVHQLVLETFVDPRPSGMQARHLDGNRENNRLDNLAWGTAAENAADKIRHGTDRSQMTHCLRGHLLDEANTYVKRDGRRQCRKCRNERRMEKRGGSRRAAVWEQRRQSWVAYWEKRDAASGE